MSFQVYQAQGLRIFAGDTATCANYTGNAGEISVNTETKAVYVHDGLTAGGTPLTTAEQAELAGITLGQLANVYLDDPQNGQIMVYDESDQKWKNQLVQGVSGEGSGGAAELDDLNDVLFSTSPNDGQVLSYSSEKGQWINKDAESFPSGTNMLFQQTTAPVGWTKQTTHNNKALRVVSGTAGSGGDHSFSTVFSKTTTNNHTLTTAQIPAHNHTTNNAGNHSHSIYVSTNGGGTNMIVFASKNRNQGGLWSNAAGNHSHSVNNNGSGGAHSHGMDIRVQYVDIIIAKKD